MLDKELLEIYWNNGWNADGKSPMSDYEAAHEGAIINGLRAVVKEYIKRCNTKTVWVAYTNTDCTEGRGYDVPIAVCELEATATRLAKNQYVQGADGPVISMEFLELNGKWYSPTAAVNLVKPSDKDILVQDQLKNKRAVYDKARKAGLTDTELKQLGVTL